MEAGALVTSLILLIGIVAASEEVREIKKRDVDGFDIDNDVSPFDRDERAIFRYGKRLFRYGKRDNADDIDEEKRLFRYGRSGPVYKRLFRYGKRDMNEIDAVKRLFRYGKRADGAEISTRTAAQQPSVPFRFGERE